MEIKNAESLLEKCNAFPLSTPGIIQAHGAIIAISKSENKIEYLSENIGDFIPGADKAWLGLPFSECALDEISGLMQMTEPSSIVVNGSGEPGVQTELTVNPVINDNYVIFEFTRKTENDVATATHLATGLTALLQSKTLAELHQNMMTAVQPIIGFGHLMIYQFDPSWNGLVVAEHFESAERDKHSSYLNLHFPESDVPAKARALYEKDWLRMIADVFAEPVGVLSNQGEALDLSRCSLRSVAPTHRQYLQNMGVNASLSISIIVEGKLWGLVAAHHAAAKPITPAMRQAAIELGQLYSSLLALKIKQEHQSWLEKNKVLLDWPIIAARDGNEYMAKERISMASIKNAFNAHGVMIITDEQKFEEGEVPDEDFLKLILTELGYVELNEGVFATEQLSTMNNLFRGKKIAGLLAIGAPAADGRWLLLFRHEEPQELFWGGDPRIDAMEVKQNNLSPRKSFEKWKDVISGCSRAWTYHELVLAKSLSTNLQLAYSTLATMESAQKTAKLNMLNMLLHDIGNAISGVSGGVTEMRHLFAETRPVENLKRLSQLIESKSEKFDEALGNGKGKALHALISEVIQHMESNAKKCEERTVDLESGLTHARELLDLQKAYAQSDKIYRRECHPAELFLDATSLLRTSIEARGSLDMRLPDKLPAVNVDRSKAMQVIVNLVKNSYEAWDQRAEPKPPLELTFGARQNDNFIELTITDNGLGFDPDNAEMLFAKNFSTKERSSGLGLANSKRLAKATGIELTLTSEGENKGATAILQFPKELWV